jgi:ribulose-5-phosphate 4-epimerase/fuculose-1-phosphate aldolase
MDGNIALHPSLLNEHQLRVDLAAAFRLAAKNDWTEAVANHFSVAVSPDGGKFLMNRAWRHFSQIRASELAILDAGGQQVPEDIDTTAWIIHATMHFTSPPALRHRLVLPRRPRHQTNRSNHGAVF